ncbi:hypothetical protein [Micromonospora okii]|uniref:hypothetical protein n=1 Tax=Micromonospora okii TaxID=1182970 RepID=UPI001E47FF70|nr:hypothetical protein [Micromonospora okii]
MTAPGGFREVDHDLLADYLGGALDGTPDEAVVARLVAEDPGWAEACGTLAPALALVDDDLAAWAAPAPEMPPDVADRLAAALAGAGPGTPADDDADDDADDAAADAAADAERMGQPGGARGVRVPPAVVPTQQTGGRRRPAAGSPPATGPGRRGRRWARLAGPVALATASMAVVGLGVHRFVGGTSRGDSAVNAPLRERAGGTAAQSAPFRTIGAPQRSGTDWTPQALAGDVPPRRVAGTPGSAWAPPEADEGARLPAVGGLDRLTGPDALAGCLTAVSAEHRAGPLTVDLVDYARFQGDPALVVRFLDPSGARWAWVSGPECGVPGSGADTRYRTRVG